MPNAARMTDKVIHDNPHCHAPIHPPAPVPTPVPHPPIPIQIIPQCVPTVLINNLMAAVVTSMTLPCMLPSCVPNGPGMIAKGSATVMIGNKPAARMGDLVTFSGCVAPIPSPTGKILPPCSPDVIVGG
jgi:uncharacterized Zn-binding protein involved in type VI secretion